LPCGEENRAYISNYGWYVGIKAERFVLVKNISIPLHPPNQRIIRE